MSIFCYIRVQEEMCEGEFATEMPDNCPLDGAVPCNTRVYLACENIRDDDPGFLTAWERGKYLKATGERACQKSGLSVFPSKEGVAHMQKLFPILGRNVATCQLTSEKGMIRLTAGNRPDHHTWWPYKGPGRSNGFENF